MVTRSESLHRGECEGPPRNAAVRIRGVNTCKVLRIAPGTGLGLYDFLPSAPGQGLPVAPERLPLASTLSSTSELIQKEAIHKRPHII